jgi:hypothetical protein
MREHYSFITSDEQVGLLNAALGCKISTLSTDSLEVRDDVISSHYFAFEISPGCWVNLSSDWGDTPKTYLDFWCFEILIADHPTRLIKKSRNSKNVMGRSFSLIHLKNPIDELVEIFVHSYADRNNDESVHCDRSITFVGRNGNSFSLSTPKTIIGWMDLITDRNTQEKVLSQFQLRKEMHVHQAP